MTTTTITSTTTTTTTVVATAPPQYIPRPGGKLDYVSFTIPQSSTYTDLLTKICSEINYEILAGEPRLCRDVRAHVVQTPEGEYIAISNLHDNHKKYFDDLFVGGGSSDNSQVTPNDFFETLLREAERGMAAVAQQLAQNHLVTVYRSSDWLHA